MHFRHILKMTFLSLFHVLFPMIQKNSKFRRSSYGSWSRDRIKQFKYPSHLGPGKTRLKFIRIVKLVGIKEKGNFCDPCRYEILFLLFSLHSQASLAIGLDPGERWPWWPFEASLCLKWILVLRLLQKGEFLQPKCQKRIGATSIVEIEFNVLNLTLLFTLAFV